LEHRAHRRGDLLELGAEHLIRDAVGAADPDDGREQRDHLEPLRAQALVPGLRMAGKLIGILAHRSPLPRMTSRHARRTAMLGDLSPAVRAAVARGVPMRWSVRAATLRAKVRRA